MLIVYKIFHILRLDNTLEEIIFKLVPGLRESKFSRWFHPSMFNYRTIHWWVDIYFSKQHHCTRHATYTVATT